MELMHSLLVLMILIILEVALCVYLVKRWNRSVRGKAAAQTEKKPEAKPAPAPKPKPAPKPEKKPAPQSPLMKMLPSLSTGGKLAEELVNNDPQALQTAIREADSAELRKLTDVLERELETADPENREILQTVLDFADEVQNT